MVALKSKRRGSAHSSRRRLSSDHTQSSRRSLITASTHESQLWSCGGDKTDIEDDFDEFEDADRQDRLVDWIVEILADLIRQIMAHRQATHPKAFRGTRSFVVEYEDGENALDEITEIISLGGVAGAKLNFNQSISCLEADPASFFLPQKAEEQLRDYVRMVACMYRDNFFHGFEHASHVTNSVQKLLKRVVIAHREKEEAGLGEDYTSNIACDPFTQFALVFCALIHDVDHTGLSNSILVKENAHIAQLYKNRCVAEQNSLDLSWEVSCLVQKYCHDIFLFHLPLTTSSILLCNHSC